MHVNRCILWLLIALVSGPDGLAQQTELKSPEVHADRSVTFRYVNQQAEEVSLTGALQSLEGMNGPLIRDDRGVWTRTVPSLFLNVKSV